jgi:hypothetical protein
MSGEAVPWMPAFVGMTIERLAMRLWHFPTLAFLLAGCAQPDPLWLAHAESQQQARAMIGKEYIIVAPLLVCRGQSDVYDFRYMGPVKRAPFRPVINLECPELGAGRFRVVEAAMLKNDGRTVLHIVGPGIDGYIPYETYLPKAFRDAQEYFATGSR